MSENGTAVVPDQRGELIGRLKAKLKETMVRLKALETERDTAVSERDAANTRAAKAQQDYDASPLKAKVDELSGKLRETAHKGAFAKLAREKGVPEDSIDLVYRESGYKAEKDEVDEAAIGSLLDEVKGRPGLSRLFGEPEPVHQPAPARGQGPRDQAAGKLKVTAAQLADPMFMAANQHRIKDMEQVD